MNEFVGEYQYVIAWLVYLGSGMIFCLFWWKVTAAIRHGGWRDLMRGLAVVVIFTPWFTNADHEFYAPAIVVVLMDLLLGSSDNGLVGVLVLLVAAAAMLGVLVVRRVLASRTHHGG